MAIQSINQGAFNVSNTTPYGDASRVGLMPTEVAKEDWIRAEQAQNNQLERDLYLQGVANEFTANQNQLDRDFNRLEAELNRKSNAKEAAKQRRYDERMSSTQYQRAVEDMKKAGINPVLAVQHGATWQGGSSSSGTPAVSNSRGSSGARSGTGNTTYAGSKSSFVDKAAAAAISILSGVLMRS